MKRLPQLGKVHKDFLENIVLSKLKSKSDLLIGPKYGFDNGVIKIDDNKIMVIGGSGCSSNAKDSFFVYTKPMMPDQLEMLTI